MVTRPRLTPAIADVRRAVRAALATLAPIPGSAPPVDTPRGAPAPNRVATTSADRGVGQLVLVALSGGPDSLALAAATAFEAGRAGIRAGAVVVDHGLQQGSADAAAAASAKAVGLGLDPVIVVTVDVTGEGGPEAAARAARYAALDRVAREQKAAAVLLGHTLNDQAETVLLGLARGSGASSLHGMAPASGLYRRPLLGISRDVIEQFCVDSGLDPWLDPQNDDRSFARVRVRKTILPVLEQGLGPGIVEALARTADQLREDDEALDHFAEEIAEDLAVIVEAGIALPVKALAANPAALRQRLIRLVVEAEFHLSLSRERTLEVARLVTDWHGQGKLDLPGISVERRDGLIVFTATDAGELTGVDPILEH